MRKIIIIVLIALVAGLFLFSNATARMYINGSVASDSYEMELADMEAACSYIVYKPWYAPTTTVAKNCTTGKIDYRSTDSSIVFDGVINSISSGSTIYVGSGTFTNLNEINPQLNRVKIIGKGKFDTDLRPKTTLTRFINFTNQYVEMSIQDLTLNCRGIPICIDNNNTIERGGGTNEQGSTVTRHYFKNILVSNATILVEESDTEEDLWDHVILGSASPTSHDYSMVINSSGGTIRIRDSLFSGANVAHLVVRGGTEIIVSRSTFTKGTGHEVYLTNTTSPRISLDRMWFENTTGANIYSDNPLSRVTITGGYFVVNPASIHPNINGTFKRLDITGTPILVGGANPYNIVLTNTTSFIAPTILAADKDISPMQGNVTYYYYMKPEYGNYFTNMTASTG